MSQTPSPLAVVLCQDRVPHAAETQLRDALLAQLGGWSGVTVRVLPHLYDLAPDGSGVAHLRAIKGDMLVLGWLYPRAAYWILDANEVRGRLGHSTFFPDEELQAGVVPSQHPGPLPDRTIWCLDLRPHHEPARLLGEIERIVVERSGPPRPQAPLVGVNGVTQIAETPRTRWYPVVDRGRCQTCMECMNFCLFGVFGLDTAGKLLVEQPDACRNGCPACARVCPSGAIMFPEHENQAIAGSGKSPAADLNSDLLQLFGPRPAADLARVERQQFVRTEVPEAEEEGSGVRVAGSAKQPSTKSPPDALDKLVDGLDQSEL